MNKKELILLISGVLALCDVNINLQSFGLIATEQDLKKFERQNKEVKNAENRRCKQPCPSVENQCATTRHMLDLGL